MTHARITESAGRRLRDKLAAKGLLQLMAAHSPLSARLADEAGFDGLWASGFELSALYGLPDVSVVSMYEHLEMTRRIVGSTSLPVVADLDTGFGNAINVIHAIKQYEAVGTAAVVIEDKSFPKVTSLVEGGRQHLVRVEEFQGKIEAALSARADDQFMVIARTEALIAGQGLDEAQRRALAYAEAGADMILVHSKSESGSEIIEFTRDWHGNVPLAIVPTSYPTFTPSDARAAGNIGLYIYGNHAIRSCVAAMKQTFKTIIDDGNAVAASQAVSPVEEVFRLQGMDRVKADETSFLR